MPFYVKRQLHYITSTNYLVWDNDNMYSCPACQLSTVRVHLFGMQAMHIIYVLCQRRSKLKITTYIQTNAL